MTRTFVHPFAACLLSVALDAQGLLQAPPSEAQLRARFDQADRNQNGRLTREEAKAGMPKVHAIFDRLDRNRKGYLTFSEVLKAVSRRTP